MTDLTFSINGGAARLADSQAAASPKLDSSSPDIGKRFEQMLWAEMLMHAGLEDALTMNGGEAASSFSRYVVEAIAADIAEQHPLGLSSQVNTLGKESQS